MKKFKVKITILLFILLFTILLLFLLLLGIKGNSPIKEASTNYLKTKTGWVIEDGKEYYYDPVTRKKASGWLHENDITYYLDPVTKEKTTGLLKLSKKLIFYFDKNGQMYKDCTINNFVIDQYGFVKEISIPFPGESQKKKIEASIAQISEKYGAEGVSVAVIENGSLQSTYQYGNAAKPSIPMEEDTKIRIASISKVVLSMIAVRMQEQNILDLSSSIGDYWGFPVKNPYYPQTPVSLFSIFTHTSSISDLASYNNIEGNLRASNIFRNISPLDPAGCYYCNYAFAVAGATVEKAGNKNIHDLANETFFDPLDIDASFISGRLKNPSLLAELYYADGSIGRSLDSQKSFQGSSTPGENGSLVVGGLCISAKDMAKLVCVLANDGNYEGKQILSKESVKMMEAPYCATDYHGVPVLQCMPLKYHTDVYGQEELYFHTGSAYGVYSLMSYNPNTKNGVVVITTGALGTQDSSGIYAVCGEISNSVYSSFDRQEEYLNKVINSDYLY